MANDTKAQWNAKKTELMGKCYNGFADLGLHGTTIRPLAEHCGCNKTMIYTYFKDFDDRIIQSTEYCMSKVEDTFMAKAPTDVEDLWWFMDEIPYWTAKKHGKKYRLLYQTTAMSREGSLARRIIAASTVSTPPVLSMEAKLSAGSQVKP